MMKNVRRIAKWLMACMITVFLAGVVSAAETTEKGEISSFNNYGENGVYEAVSYTHLGLFCWKQTKDWQGKNLLNTGTLL